MPSASEAHLWQNFGIIRQGSAVPITPVRTKTGCRRGSKIPEQEEHGDQTALENGAVQPACGICRSVTGRGGTVLGRMVRIFWELFDKAITGSLFPGCSHILWDENLSLFPTRLSLYFMRLVRGMI